MEGENSDDDIPDDVPSMAKFLQENIPLKNLRTIRYSLKTFDESRRKDIIDFEIEGKTSLFVACEYGHDELVDFFLEECKADANKEGWYSNNGKKVQVTPLWLSVVEEKGNMVKQLLDHGANVNTLCKSGTTAVHAACYMGNLETIQLLCEHGADVNLTNSFGDNCLKDSVDEVEICRLLLKYGADVNQKTESQYSILHKAIKTQDLETVELLVESGADMTAQDFEGNDCLRYAVLNYCPDIVEYLLNVMDAGPANSADTHDLLGAVAVRKGMYDKAYEYWLKAVYLRTERGGGFSEMTVLDCFGEVEIPHTIRDLIALVKHCDKMDKLSLVILDNQLGSCHGDTIHGILLQSSSLFHEDKLLEAFDLSYYAYSLLTKKYKPLHKLQEFALKQLVRIYERLQVEHEAKDDRTPRLDEMVDIFQKTVNHIKLGFELRQSDTEYFNSQDTTFENIILHSFDMIYILTGNLKTAQEKSHLKTLINALVDTDPKTLQGSNLLHLVLTRSPKFEFLNNGECSHADLVVTRELISSGTDVNAQDLKRDTPLHSHLKWINDFNFFSKKILAMFLKYGAHIDLPDINGVTVMSMLNSQSVAVCPVKNLTLQCLAVGKIIKHAIPYRSDLPVAVQLLIDMHK